MTKLIEDKEALKILSFAHLEHWIAKSVTKVPVEDWTSLFLETKEKLSDREILYISSVGISGVTWEDFVIKEKDNNINLYSNGRLITSVNYEDLSCLEDAPGLAGLIINTNENGQVFVQVPTSSQIWIITPISKKERSRMKTVIRANFQNIIGTKI